MICARNIITANFSGGGTSATTAPLWQWDYGQVLCVTGIEDLPAAFEVHFSTNKTGGVSTVAVGADGQVTIPNVLLTIGKNLNAWIYLSDAQGEGETEYSILIPVKARPMPETYDAETSGEFDDVVRQVSEYAQTAQTAADNAGASATAAATSADNAAASASAAETAKTAAETAQGKAEDAQAAAETAAQTATEKAQQTEQDAAQAAQSKADAESAAQRAEAAQTGAESAKTDAETAAQGAADSASAASASATSAGQAASAAAQSATAAAQSAASIEGDVQTASQKAAEATAAADQAVAAKDAAQTAQQGAEVAETNAGQSASTATTKAVEAAQSASSAAQSKTDAEAAATRAEQAAASLTVDSALSDTSTNPVQNKVITGEVTQLKSHISEYVEMLGERTTQLLNYVEAEIINGFANNGAIILANPARSAIIPVNVIASSTITITRKIITSRFIVSSHTTKPEIGTSAVNTVTNNGGASLQIPVDSSIKYLCLYFYNTGSDSALDETECLKSIMVNVGDYDGFENYFIPDVADRSITGGKLASELEDAIDAIASATAEPSKIKQLTITGVQSLTWTEGYYYNTTTGQKQTAPDFAHSQKIAVNYNDTFFITNHAGSVLFYDAYDTYLGFVNTKYNATVAFGAISGASYIILNCLNLSYKASTMDLVLSGEVVSNVLTQKNDAGIGLVYDASYFVATRYVNTVTGVINSISNFYGTAPLAIKPSHKYRIAKQSQIVYFDEKMVYLNSVVPTPINIESELDVTTPATAHYMAVNSLFADNAIYDLEYVPVLKTERKLDEKTVVCFGDSIIGNYAYGDNIPYQIEKHTGAKVYNVGFGGCRMENLVNDPQHTNYFSMVGIVDALESGDWTNQDAYASSIGAMVAKRLEVLKSIDFNDVDIVTIEYGTNEYGYTQEDPEDPYNVYTYGGAIRYSIEKLLELYPQIKICFFTPIYRYFPESSDDSDTHEHPTMHGKLTDNVATMKSVANEYKLPCVDMYYTGGINKYNWTHYLNMDGTHPNSDGRKLLGCRYAGELNRLF